MKLKGLYRTHDLLFGDCAKVHWSGGDAAPILPAAVYRQLNGNPPYSELPERAEYEARGGTVWPDPFEL